MNSGLVTLLVVLAIVIFFWRIFPTAMFITTQFAGTPISFMDLLFMKLRKIDIDKVGNSYIMLRKSNIDINLRDLETAYLLKHDLENITRGLIISKQKNTPLTFEQAKEADKKGIKMADELIKIEQG